MFKKLISLTMLRAQPRLNDEKLSIEGYRFLKFAVKRNNRVMTKYCEWLQFITTVIKSIANNFTSHCAGGQFRKALNLRVRAAVVNSVPEIGYEVIRYFIELALLCRAMYTVSILYIHIHMLIPVCMHVSCAYMTECASVGNRPVSPAVATLNCGARMLNTVNRLLLR